MSAPTSVPVQYQTEDGANVTNLVTAMGAPASVPCGKALTSIPMLTDKGKPAKPYASQVSCNDLIVSMARLIGNRTFCPDCADLIAKNGTPITVSADYPVLEHDGGSCGDTIVLPKPANWTGGYSGYGANVARLTAAAKHCAKQGDGYLPPSKQGTEDEPTSFFRQRLGINDNLIREQAPVVTERKTPSKKPTTTTTPDAYETYAATARATSTVDWEAQYHMAEANYILVKSENDRLRGRLTDLGFTVTGKPGLAHVTR